MHNFKVGDSVSVFCGYDDTFWRSHGDIGTHNNFYYDNGKVIKLWTDFHTIVPQVLADIKLDSTGKISRGHFLWGIRPPIMPQFEAHLF